MCLEFNTELVSGLISVEMHSYIPQLKMMACYYGAWSSVHENRCIVCQKRTLLWALQEASHFQIMSPNNGRNETFLRRIEFGFPYFFHKWRILKSTKWDFKYFIPKILFCHILSPANVYMSRQHCNISPVWVNLFFQFYSHI